MQTLFGPPDAAAPSLLASKAEERDLGVEQAREVEGMDVLGRAVEVGEGQMALEQRLHVGSSRVVEPDLALNHAQEHTENVFPS